MALRDQSKAEEPDLAEVNRLMRGEPAPGVTSRTVDVEYALSVLRNENARLKEAAKVNADTYAQNREMQQKNCENLRKEIFKVHNELFASQEKVYELQKQLLALRTIINNPTARECAT